MQADGPRAWLHTFGCKANQYDSERMRQALEARGAVAVGRPSDADLAVLNTCTVTSEADRDARRLIRRLGREHPDLRIVVAGCSAALRGTEYERMEEVWRVVPGQDPGAVAGAVAVAETVAAAETVAVAETVAEGPVAGSAELVGLRRRGGSLLARFCRGTRAWLKVQDGCDRRCSFCATRLARGASRSRPPAELVREARLLAREHPELVLTGIHIGHYGTDLRDGSTLADLCARLLDAVVGVRLRLSSIEATEIDERLVDLMAASNGRLVPHLHVPLQSGSDAVLGRMRRWHTREDYRARMLEIAARLPYLGLGADIITGFPGETDADHAATRRLVEELPYTYLHVFPFSARSGTVASTMPNPVDRRLSAERARELREIGLAKGRAYRSRRWGGAAEVVVETVNARGGNGSGGFSATGLTEDYLRVEIRPRASAGSPSSGGDTPKPGDAVRGRLEGDPDRLRLRPERSRGIGGVSEEPRTAPMPAS